jgi:hypothetical protein
MATTTRPKGWMQQLLLDGDQLFGAGRWAWWLDAEGIPETDIPRIDFQNSQDTAVAEHLQGLGEAYMNGPPLSAAGGLRHLEKLVESIGFGWSSLRYLMEWMEWGLGLSEKEPVECQPGAEEMLYRDFHLGRLQAANCDLFGAMMCERTGKGKWNPNAFFPTPPAVVECMVQMIMHDGVDKTSSVMDPCVGTGRFLMHASNYSVNLFGVDIDPLCVLATKLNAALYMPWLICPKKQNVPTPDPVMVCEQREAQGHPPSPKTPKVSRRGQLFLFDEE